jgi:hypothetical protein
MTAITVDNQMPKVVQMRRYEESTVSSSDFAETEMSIENLMRQVGKRNSTSYNANVENIVFKKNYIPRKHTSSNILDESESVVLPETYLTDNLSNEKTFLFPETQHFQEEVEEDFLRGVQPINHQYKILSTQKVELKISELRRWRPTIVVDPVLFEDDE